MGSTGIHHVDLVVTDWRSLAFYRGLSAGMGFPAAGERGDHCLYVARIFWQSVHGR